MKHTMKRSLSLVLALCMVLGLVVLPGVTEAKAEGETASSLISTPVYSHSMDDRNPSTSGHSQYLPLGWTYSNQNMAGSSIRTDGGRTYFKASLSADKNAYSWGSYNDATNFDNTVALSYDFMMDNSAVTDTWTVRLPSFGTGKGAHTISVIVVDNVLKCDGKTKTLTPGQWYNLVLVLNGTRVAVYLDGELFVESTASGTLSWLVMGLDGNSTTNTKGLGFCLDDLKVYDYVAGTGFSADAETYSVAVNSTVATYWTKTSADAYLPSVTYTSSDDTVATVDENGVVTGLKDGTATITATPAASSGMAAATTTVVVGEGVKKPVNLSTPIYSHDMEMLNGSNTTHPDYVGTSHSNYLPIGWTRSGSSQNFAGSSIKTSGDRKYFSVALTADKNANSWGYYSDATNFDNTVALSYSFMVDNSAVTDTWTVFLPSFGTGHSSHTIGITVVNNVLTYDTNKRTLTPGQWYDLVLILNGTEVVVYLDGEKFAEDTISSATLNYLVMGLAGSGSTNTKGLGFCLDDLKVYDYVAGTGFSADAETYSVAVNSTVATYWSKVSADAYLPSVTYTSSDNSVATVDKNGVVTGLKDGTVTITATPAASSGMSAATTTVVVGTGEEQRPELKFSTAAPVLENNLAILFKADASLFTTDGYSNPSATFQFNSETYEVSDYTVEGDKYVFKFSGIAPHQMGDEITYTLKATYDGEEVSSTAKTYSILTYCNYYLTSTNESLKTLLVDTLNYGAAAQNYKSYKTDALVNAALSEEQKNFKAPELENKTTQNGEATVASWTNAALVLDNAITVRLKFSTEADISGLTVKVNGAEVAIAGTANNYYVDYNGLDAGQLRDDITAEIYQGDTLVSKTLTFSAEYYAAYQAQSSTDANLVALVKAMMKYGDSAAAFENN